MRVKKWIRKGLMVTGVLVLGTALIVMLVAAMKIRNRKECMGVHISYRGDGGGRYVTQAAVARLLDTRGLSAIKGSPLHELDLKAMEKRLEKDPWVNNAEIYIDGKHVLQVKVQEKHPVARLFTIEGESFYTDSNMHRIPLSQAYTPRLPVFTSLPLKKGKMGSRDSLLMSDILGIVRFLQTDSLWMAQIDQCEYDPLKGFILIPKIGEHRILIGNGQDIREKFRKLSLFYVQVMSVSGWSSYTEVDLRFKGQIVAVPADTAWLSTYGKNVERESHSNLSGLAMTTVPVNDVASVDPGDPTDRERDAAATIVPARQASSAKEKNHKTEINKFNSNAPLKPKAVMTPATRNH
jgi:cell division protein FtsQ